MDGVAPISSSVCMALIAKNTVLVAVACTLLSSLFGSMS